MPNIQIKDVPEETYAVLRERAAAAHQSLQEYLRARLIKEAHEPTLDEVLNRAGVVAGGKLSLADEVSALRLERARPLFKRSAETTTVFKRSAETTTAGRQDAGS